MISLEHERQYYRIWSVVVATHLWSNSFGLLRNLMNIIRALSLATSHHWRCRTVFNRLLDTNPVAINSVNLTNSLHYDCSYVWWRRTSGCRCRLWKRTATGSTRWSSSSVRSCRPASTVSPWSKYRHFLLYLREFWRSQTHTEEFWTCQFFFVRSKYEHSCFLFWGAVSVQLRL